MGKINQERINRIVQENRPKPLPHYEPLLNFEDHSNHLFELVRMGQTSLAADHLLFPEINGRLSKTVGDFIRRLHILFATSRPLQKGSSKSFFQNLSFRQYSCEVLLEMALNFFGLESRWLDPEEKSRCIEFILHTLEGWEEMERKEGDFSVAWAVIQGWLLRMKRVQKGNSMVAQTALRIEESLEVDKPLFPQFLKRAREEIEGNIYYRMVSQGLCRFGNDYALGLRWLRHLGYEQVSTNPVLAARAYQDDPYLVESFQEDVQRHPRFRHWRSNPSKYAEEIVLYATLFALWENLYVFRPIFFNLRDSSGGGVVSFQLNPNIAHLVEESIRDVFLVFSLAQENLMVYDRYLLAGYRIDGERGRPNLVIKVAATGPSARKITRVINSFGFGSNITVDFSVSQEATLLLEEMEGMAEAIRKGIRPTQLYMTNMGGRLESHLREVKLEEFFRELKEEIGEERATEKVLRLSEVNGTKQRVCVAKCYEEKVIEATRYVHGQRTIDESIVEALSDVVSKETLQGWEEAIGRSGALIARRLWWIFFSPENRRKWISYLMRTKGVSEDQASLILDRIYYLPASKRKPLDTFWTLSSKNLVHTEFPDHQENVRRMAEQPGFELEEFRESISSSFPDGVLERLYGIEDFVKAYEINPELSGIFKEAGISGDFGQRGLLPSEWPTFGPVQKTLSEFKSAYNQFQKEMMTILKKIPKKKGQ